MKQILIAILMALSLRVPGCLQEGTPSDALAGSSWRLTAWTCADYDPANYTVTASFTETDIHGTSAVNHYSGAYAATNAGELTIGPLASTLMAGPEDAMEVEQRYVDLLSRVRAFRMDATSLMLQDDTGQTLLVFERVPNPE